MPAKETTSAPIDRIVDRVSAQLFKLNRDQAARMPSTERVLRAMRHLQFLLYPMAASGENELGLKVDLPKTLVEVYKNLSHEMAVALCNEKASTVRDAERERAAAVTGELLEALPGMRKVLDQDLDAVQQRDPAARNRAEVVLSYPGFEALTIHRLAHFLHMKGIPLLPRMMSEIVHRDTGIDIHPAAQIGPSCSIDHGTGLIIGETTVIGRNVSLYHNVTLGARSVSTSMRNKKRHPTIGDNVIIYPGTTILGDILIGSGSTIGGNCFLLEGCPPNTTIYSKPPEMTFRTRGS